MVPAHDRGQMRVRIAHFGVGEQTPRGGPVNSRSSSQLTASPLQVIFVDHATGASLSSDAGNRRDEPVRITVSVARRRAGSGVAGADCGGSGTGAGSAAGGWFQMRVRSRNPRRHPPIQRSVIAFMRGVRMLQSTARIVGAGNLCHQVIFAGNAASAVTPLYREMIQIGNAVRQTERHGLVQRAALICQASGSADSAPAGRYKTARPPCSACLLSTPLMSASRSSEHPRGI